MIERQVDQETVAIVQSAEDECRNKGMEDGRRYAATNASQLTQGGKATLMSMLRRDGNCRPVIIIIFDPGTQFPGNEKNTLGNTKKYKNEAGMNLSIVIIIAKCHRVLSWEPKTCLDRR